MVEAFEEVMRRGGTRAIHEVSSFLTGGDAILETLLRVASICAARSLPYAVAGNMAMVAHGYCRVTAEIEVLVTPHGREALRDLEFPFPILLRIPGQPPVGSKGTALVYPEPHEAGVEIGGVRYLRLPLLMDLKLAAAEASPPRMIHVGDALGLIVDCSLSEQFAKQLNPLVRQKYLELWQAAASAPPEE